MAQLRVPSPEPANAPVVTDPGGTKLTVVANRMEAEELSGMLRTNGIKCGYVLSDTAGAIALVSARVRS